MEASTAVKPTAKQAKVLGYVKEGKTPAEIAKRLRITTNGVYGHIRKLKAKGLIDGGDPAPASSNGSHPTASLEEVHLILAKAKDTAAARVEAIQDRLTAIKATAEELANEREGLEKEAAALIAATSNV